MHLGSVVQPVPGDRILSLLPPWHMYERSAEYFALSRGVSQVYTSVKSLKVELLHDPWFSEFSTLVTCLFYSLTRSSLLDSVRLRCTVSVFLGLAGGLGAVPTRFLYCCPSRV